MWFCILPPLSAKDDENRGGVRTTAYQFRAAGMERRLVSREVNRFES